MALWTLETPLSGAPVILADISGASPLLLDCDICPCEQWCHLAAVAIRERQLAVGWSYDQCIRTDTDYTISELLAEAYKIYQIGYTHLVDPDYNDWDGGYDWPPRIPANYFFGIYTCEQLYNAVIRICHSIYECVSEASAPLYTGSGSAATPWDAAAAALASWTLSSGPGHGWSYNTMELSGGLYYMTASARRDDTTIGPFPSTIRHAIKLYAHGLPPPGADTYSIPYIYSQQGQPVPATEYLIEYVQTLPFTNNVTEGPLYTLDPSIFPATYGVPSVGSPSIMCGFQHNKKAFVQWEFSTSTCPKWDEP